MTLLIFWISVALLVYTYFVFPLLVLLRSRLWPKPYVMGDRTPFVSMIVAAHNEASCIARKIKNVLQLDYPAGSIELIVASDGSTDGTAQIARQFADARVRVLELPRGGKAQALNTAIAGAAGSVLVFTDANSMLEPGSVRALVRPFTDSNVGGVAGDQRYQPAGKSGAENDGERSYWSFDRLLKRAESRAGSVISATGALYAIRKELFIPVPEGVTDDFVTSTRIIEQSYRLVFCEEAVAWEPAAAKQQVEFGRKVRVIGRGLRGVVCMRKLLNPLQFGFYSLQLFSHKVLRRLMVLPLITVFISGSLLSLQEGQLYSLITVSQLFFYVLAACGAMAAWIGVRQHKLIALPAYFCMVNVAALVAACQLIAGKRTVLWEPQRAEGGPGVAGS